MVFFFVFEKSSGQQSQQQGLCNKTFRTVRKKGLIPHTPGPVSQFLDKSSDMTLSPTPFFFHQPTNWPSHSKKNKKKILHHSLTQQKYIQLNYSIQYLLL